MITCPKCNKELSDDTKFCDSCGAQIFETIFCPNCGVQTSTEFAFCENCGASIAEKPVEEQQEAAPAPSEVPQAGKTLSKKPIMFGAIGVAVLAVLIILITQIFGGGKTGNNYVAYVKDEEIFFSGLKKGGESWQLTSRLVDSDDMDRNNLAYAGYTLGSYTYMSEDGKYIFYPDKISSYSNGFNLYCRKTDKPEAEAMKIDSGVIQFHVAGTPAALVTYFKEGKDIRQYDVYQYKIAEDSKDKLASDVVAVRVSDDGKKIGYLNDEGNIYLKDAGKEKEKVVGDVDSLEYIDETFTFYYIKGGSLYKQSAGEDRVKIASDIYDIIEIYDSGEIYYLKSESKETSLMDYVTDDMREEDAFLEKPEEPASISRRSYGDYLEYVAAVEAYEKEYKEYRAAYEKYREKLQRDDLRESLKEGTVGNFGYSLCYYNGTEETVITDSCVGGYEAGSTVAKDVAVISYEAYNQSEPKKIKLSEIVSVSDVRNTVQAALFDSTEKYIAVKDIPTVVEQEKSASDFEINGDGTIVYYMDNISDTWDYGDLYRISISNGVVGKAELYDSDVYTAYSYFIDDSKLGYFKDIKDEMGEFYIDKVRIDYDVYTNNYYYDDSDNLFYFTDWDYGKSYGTLKVSQGGEAVKIADDVHAYSVTDEGQVLYLYDYSTNHCVGELHEWSNGKTRKIDDDVVCIIIRGLGEHKGGFYGW